MRRDLLMMDQICYLGEQELGKTQAPQLEAVSRRLNAQMGNVHA
jgi:hypothetical protein